MLAQGLRDNGVPGSAITVELSNLKAYRDAVANTPAGTLLAMTVCAFSLTAIQYRSPLPAMSQKAWWLVLPAVVAVLGFIAFTGTPHALLRYAY